MAGRVALKDLGDTDLEGEALAGGPGGHVGVGGLSGYAAPPGRSRRGLARQRDARLTEAALGLSVALPHPLNLGLQRHQAPLQLEDGREVALPREYLDKRPARWVGNNP